MHARVAKLTIGAGAAGDADALVSRISSDLVAAYSAAPGFIGYYNVEEDASTVYSIRVFIDATTLDDANTATTPAQTAIATDFALTVDSVVADDVGSGAAYALITA
jgi:hypothetical protein